MHLKLFQSIDKEENLRSWKAVVGGGAENNPNNDLETKTDYQKENHIFLFLFMLNPK